LLTALADEGGGAVSVAALAEAVWPEPDDRPESPAKALQVVVSRARKATEPAAIMRTDGGYRLALEEGDVDLWAASAATERARAALAAGDGAAAESAAIAARTSDAVSDSEGLLGRALELQGRHDEALPHLRAVAGRIGPAAPDLLLAALLRSEAAVDGPATALARYDRHRDELADRLGVDPSPRLQRLHRELLARDRPVRSGLRYDATELVGRERDIDAVTALLNRSRVVTLLGPGGLGKTRLAYVLARLAEQSTVHAIELVGVTTAEDLVAEIGTVLGIRSLASARRAYSTAQRASVRAQIAEQLSQAPTLLMLDNCEHIVEAVADLTSFLVAAVPGLTVLATSRSPLAIAAERVYPLAQLDDRDATALFRERALAARPGASLSDSVVDDIVARLDGLPLAIELAAVKIRSMSADEILRRLANRFELLRGGDRSAPDRHKTLLAVIDWSWNLLGDRERRSLRRLSIFQDGFSSEAAEALIGDDALASVAELADQSLVAVADEPGGVRYRMLETVREFGYLRLVDSGDEADARAAQRAWGVAFAAREASRMFGPDQLAVIDALSLEEANLAEILRRALHDDDPASAVWLYASIAGVGGVRGDMPRARTLSEPLADVLVDWTPPEALADATRAAVSLAMLANLVRRGREHDRLSSTLRRVGIESTSPLLNVLIAVAMSMTDSCDEAANARCLALADAPQRPVRALGWLYRAQLSENAGAMQDALDATKRALDLIRDADGPWSRASVEIMLSNLYAQKGEPENAGAYAESALPLLERIGAHGDALQASLAIALADLSRGRIDAATRSLARIERRSRETGSADRGAILLTRAQLRIATGDIEGGLAMFRSAAEQSRADAEFS
ncbi:MAG: AAA family ATPase, partial [Pseudoclavibacter sp.]